jgi:hypothetical protein
MLFKIGKMTPWCPKRIPGVEYTGVFKLLGDEYTVLWSLDSSVMNTLGSRLFSVLSTNIRRGLQKNILVNNRPGSQDSPVY